MQSKFLLAVCLFSLCPLAHRAATLTLQPVADTYFETYGSEKANFGGAQKLRMDQWKGRQVFLKFELSGLSRERLIRHAELRLFVLESSPNENGEFLNLKTCVEILDVVTPWTETGLAFNSPDGRAPWKQGAGLREPGYSSVGPLAEPDTGVHLRKKQVPLDANSVTNGAYLRFDLTDYVRDRLGAGASEISLLLRASVLAKNLTFASRESPEMEQRPALLIEQNSATKPIGPKHRFLTQWQPKLPVEIRFESAPAPGEWRFLNQPVSSRLGQASLRADTNRLVFTPDVAGYYRVGFFFDDNSAPETAEVYVLSVPSHPRLYVSPERLSELRRLAKSGDRVSDAFLAWTRAGGTRAEAGRFHDMGPHEGCENSSLAWLITGERGYLDQAKAYAKVVLSKPMRAHFEDVHAATFLGAAWVHAIALHYDWCYPELTETERQRASDWLKEAAFWAYERSSAPIAHNDGGARQCLLASAALALLGDDPAAEQLFRLSHQNFRERLLPWLNDGGRGGRSGDGGEYEGLHAFYLVRFAWLSHTAAGEDVFSESPFFFNRLKHLQFGWYPRKLVERNGNYSMRQYYSPSGDHIRLGYVGDTQPYQSAAALCARYAATPEARGVRWLAGSWPTQWMQYTLRWAVLSGFDHLPAREPTELAYLDPGCNTVYARSDWSDDATWVLFENAPFVSAHGSLDSGTFEIFKGDLLAARTGNLDHANVGAKHSMNYLHRTIAGNCLLIHDPAEKWKGFLGGAEGGNDGGGQRTNFPLGSSPDAETYLNYRELFQRGQIRRYRNEPVFTTAMADLTGAYNNPRQHGGKLNRPKVTSVTRQITYLRELDVLAVFDRVSSCAPEFKKIWLLHSLGELEVDGKETQVEEGLYRYAGAQRAVIRYGWPKPVPSFGRCLSVTMAPVGAVVTRIGGRVDLTGDETAGYPGDQWHGKHRHRHIKDFWVNGTNYPPGNPPETRWFGEPSSSSYVRGTPDESGGRGKWRVEVSPANPALDDVFFHLLAPRLGREGSFPEISSLDSPGFYGALVEENTKAAAVFFSREEALQTRWEARLPEKPVRLIVHDLEPGMYEVSPAAAALSQVSVDNSGVICLESRGGQVRMQKR